MSENYTPGYTQIASDFMAERSLASHASFALPYLQPSFRLLDCGCGPGSISCDFAEILIAGHVHGIDREDSQIKIARDRAQQRNLKNAKFDVASIYDLPFEDASFDFVFAHAVFEHLLNPEKAIQQISRVLKPDGFAAIRSPDWGGFLVGPEVTGLEDAIRNYAELQTANGGDIHIGRKLPRLMREAGFTSIEFSAQYDCQQSPSLIAKYLSLKLNASDTDALRRWSEDSDAYFAQAWCCVIGTNCS